MKETQPAPTFSVFTATWNRRSTLPRVYRSLERQTFRDFEWIIVDDGSTDGTGELVGEWVGEANFPIHYFTQEHAGKHAALNRGVQEARGFLFVSLDSDDECVPEALQRFLEHWQAIPAESRPEFFGVAALAMDVDGRVIGSRFPRDILDSNSTEIRYRYRVRGDKWAAMRTDVLRRYPFPTIEGNLYVPEALTWAAIAREYRLRFVNEALLVCHRGDRTVAHRRPDLVSMEVGAPGNALWHRTVLNEQVCWFWIAPLQIAKSAIFYVRFSCFSRRGLIEQFRGLSGVAGRILWVVGLLPGLWLCLRDRRVSKRIDTSRPGE